MHSPSDAGLGWLFQGLALLINEHLRVLTGGCSVSSANQTQRSQ
jgi:hypothetical protein